MYVSSVKFVKKKIEGVSDDDILTAKTAVVATAIDT